MDSNALFERITTEYLAHLYASQPVLATTMGVHDYDDLLPDLSRHALDDELRKTRALTTAEGTGQEGRTPSR